MKKGVDAPYALFGMTFAAILFCFQAIRTNNLIFWISTIVLSFSAVTYFHTTYFGKYKIIEAAVRRLHIKTDNQILDLGTGHGIVLTEVAKYLKVPGKATGIDIWRSSDQSNNSSESATSNIHRLGYEKVANVMTANMLALPFPDNSFDIITASLSIHNLKSNTERAIALTEATRVLKPNGKLLIIDLKYAREYQETLLHSNQFTTVQSVKNGYNGWWGGPWMATTIITAQKNK
ncbi:class I SAM-dependent methyltransferase [Fructobacillus durionis]|uniref:Methyltransferase domain-containing protein n=1 Tax=Fructobacillus durionis TaxID=283737 RepID=A0A1I1F401_9LACO|nr:methyltransferase domain-containing protein [Fructobacillus durionis]SFB93997.1 Methyltransferase domain-containing protein [Fructobacillus durionis]